MLKRRLLAGGLLLSLTACSQNIAGTAEQMCNSIQPVSISKRDVLTPDTKKSIAGTNAGIETWCTGHGNRHSSNRAKGAGHG